MIITVIGYTLLSTTKYYYIAFILLFSRLAYWILLAVEYAWEVTNAGVGGSGNISSPSTTSGFLYKKYPWRHTILFDVIPIIQTIVPFVIYMYAKNLPTANNIRAKMNMNRKALV
jgi:lipopolysaccharide assembly outer membrane protein LptD (OstA)